MSTVVQNITTPRERGEADGTEASGLAAKFGHWDAPQRDAACRARAHYALERDREEYREGFMRGWAAAEAPAMSTHDADAQHLVDLYDAKWAINHENAQRPTDGPGRLMGAHIDAAIEAGRRQDEACEAFRRKHYPRAGRVIVGLGMVSVLSPKGQRGRIVYGAGR